MWTGLVTLRTGTSSVEVPQTQIFGNLISITIISFSEKVLSSMELICYLFRQVTHHTGHAATLLSSMHKKLKHTSCWNRLPWFCHQFLLLLVSICPLFAITVLSNCTHKTLLSCNTVSLLRACNGSAVHSKVKYSVIICSCSHDFILCDPQWAVQET